MIDKIKNLNLSNDELYVVIKFLQQQDLVISLDYLNKNEDITINRIIILCSLLRKLRLLNYDLVKNADIILTCFNYYNTNNIDLLVTSCAKAIELNKFIPDNLLTVDCSHLKNIYKFYVYI